MAREPDSDARKIHLLGGIDEAGLGPLLGPLVVGGLLLEGPAGVNPWDLLSEVFCKKPLSRRDRRIRIADSKKVKTGKKGLRELERTALTLHYCATKNLPEVLGDFLEGGLCGTGRKLGAYPWYEGLEAVPLPRWQDRRALELQAHLALRSLEKEGVRCLSLPFHPVLVGDFNRHIALTDNKSLTLFEATLPVLRQLLASSLEGSGGSVTLVLDRQGGRGRYRPLLEPAFPGHELRVLVEGRGLSRYLLDSRIELIFTEDGEDKAFPTAAASCLAKYVRELLVERLNSWFRGRLPGLAPTAGYYTDGRRFLEDLTPIEGSFPRHLLVRCR